MTRPIKRRVEFPPPYGHELPLPSDTSTNNHSGVVNELLTLWFNVRRARLPREEEAVRVNRFFDDLDEEEKEWLEGENHVWRKPRAVLVKQRALQLVQRGVRRDELPKFLAGSDSAGEKQ